MCRLSSQEQQRQEINLPFTIPNALCHMTDINVNKTQGVKHALAVVNYRHPSVLAHYISEAAMILPARITKTTPFLQRKLGREIKRARFLALMAYQDNHR